MPSGDADIQGDGSFCGEPLDPGEYILLFVAGAEGDPTAISYFPGTTKRRDAEKVEVRAGEHIQNLLIKVPFQPTYSVKGTVSSFAKASLEFGPEVFLLDADQFFTASAYTADVSPDGSFEFARVLPGKYWAVVNVDCPSDARCLTKKVAVDVDSNVSGLSLTLVRK